MARLFKVYEAAERLRSSRWTVYTLVKSGQLRAVRLTPRGPLLFTEEALDEVVRRAEAEGGLAQAPAGDHTEARGEAPAACLAGV